MSKKFDELDIEEKIELIMEQYSKGHVTKNEMQDGLKEFSEKFLQELMADSENELNKKLTETEMQVKEAEEALGVMRKQIKHLMSSSSHLVSSCKMFGSTDAAEAFGLSVLAIAKEAMGQMSRRDSIIKTLDSRGVELKAMDGGDNITGGYFVPDQFINTLIALQESYGAFRANTTVWPMSSPEGSAPSLMGDLPVYCPALGIEPADADLKAASIGLQALTWMSLMFVGKDLMEDSAIALAPIIMQQFARAFAKKEDQIGFMGDGTLSYFNIMGLIPSLLGVTESPSDNPGIQIQKTAGDWTAMVEKDFLGIEGRLPDFADTGDTKYFCHRNFYYSVMLNIASNMGGTTLTEMIEGLRGRQKMFHGYPVQTTHVMPKVKPAADHIPVILGDLKQAAKLGELRKRGIARSDHVKFTIGQVTLLGTQRSTITIHGQKSIEDTDTLAAGAYVGLLGDIG